jgi:hypothetical protein
VRGGLAEKNVIEDNRSYGVSIGHRDTDNLVRDNDILRSGKVGVLFRPERGPGFAPDRNRIENNRILDSGADKGIALDIQGVPEGIAIAGNTIRDSRPAASRIAIRIGAGAGTVHLGSNLIEGYATPIADLRKR